MCMRDLVNVFVFMNKFILAENPSSRELFHGTSSFLTFVLASVCLFCVSSMSCTLPAPNIISRHLLIPPACLHASLCLFFTWAAFHCWRLLFCSGLSNFVQLFLAFLSQALECFLLLACMQIWRNTVEDVDPCLSLQLGGRVQARVQAGALCWLLQHLPPPISDFASRFFRP